MPVRVTDPELGVLNFPDGMSDEDMSHAIERERLVRNPKTPGSGPSVRAPALQKATTQQRIEAANNAMGTMIDTPAAFASGYTLVTVPCPQ